MQWEDIQGKTYPVLSSKPNKGKAHRCKVGSMKLYNAVTWSKGPDEPGQRVSVCAGTAREAKEKLEAEYGEGTVFDLHNEEDAARPR